MKSNLRINNYILLLIMIYFCIFLAGCSSKITFTSKDMKYQLIADSEWKENNDVKNAIFEISDSKNERIILAFLHNKKTYTNYKDLTVYDKDYTQAMIKSVYPDTQIFKTENVKLDNYNAVLTKINSTSEGNTLVGWFYSIETTDDFITIIGMLPINLENQYGAKMIKVMTSLKIK